MASKSGQHEPEKAEVIEELLDALDTAIDRVKVLYEQYFLGIQKQPPAYLHTDAERKIRDLAQIQIRNTALRYRFATLQQKYGSYNSYWRRTLRQIENGTYARNLSRVGRQAAKTGAAVPEEILAAMPRRMREQVIRDREAALALARLREQQAQDGGLLTLAGEEADVDDLDAAFIHEPTDVRRNALAAGGAHRVDEADAEFDVDGFFASVIQDDAASREPSSRPPVAAPGAAAARSRRPSTKRPPIDEGPPSFAETTGAATRKITGSMRAVRPPSSPGIEPSPPRGAMGPMQAARPPSNDDTEPRLSIPPVGAASPAAATRKITGPMRTVRPPSVDDSEPSSARPERVTGQTTAVRPPASGGTERRLSIPPIGAASPAAATRRITPPVRAAGPPSTAPSQATQPLRIAPGSAADHAATPVETLTGPFPRIPGPASSLAPARVAGPPEPPPIPAQPPADRAPAPPPRPTSEPAPAEVASPVSPPASSPPAASSDAAASVSAASPPAPRRPPLARPATPPPVPKRADASRPAPPERPPPEPRQAPPPGMTDADVNALYAKYVKAKQILGEEPEPGIYGKLLKTINAQAPKIMEQYKASGVDFSVVVKDNQVIIRAKPRP